MKLELKHIAPYLPYGLKCTNTKKSYTQTGEDRTGILETLSVNTDDSVIMGAEGYFLVGYHEILPLFRPLSSLTKEIEVNGEKFVPLEKLCSFYGAKFNDSYVTDNAAGFVYGFSAHDVLNIKDVFENKYWQIQKLFEWHFDVFGLIEKGMAVEIED